MTKPRLTKFTLLAALIITIAVIAGACSSASGNETTTQSGQQTDGIIRPTWIDAVKVGDTVSIAKNEVMTAGMTHFKLEASGQRYNFMAYTLDGEIYVRANVCPPCRSIGFSLDGDELVCNSCGTRFDAFTGDGISGACKDFPKASVVYKGDDRIVMLMDDLVTAYENTTKPGWS